MKFATLALVLLFAVALVATATQTFDNVVPYKHDPGITPPAGKFQGGDTIETCTIIGALPYFTTGTTAGFVDNYDEVCPYSGSTSPDVVYCWTADFTGCVDIHTCESGYDTKIYVYENVYNPGYPHACNDDSADCPGASFRSWIQGMCVTEGNTYYIVVDGYGGDFGDYLFNMYGVTCYGPCNPEVCPSGAFVETEPVCYDGYIDVTNVGCNDPSGIGIFEYPGLNTVICGASGNYDDNYYRDMDWFEVTLTEAKTIEFCACTSFQGRIWILDGNAGCPGAFSIVSVAGGNNCWFCATANLAAGTYYFVVSIDGWLNVPCGSPYKATIFEEGVTPVEESSWGSIKSLYR
jgi:hypothetical protein